MMEKLLTVEDLEIYYIEHDKSVSNLILYLSKYVYDLRPDLLVKPIPPIDENNSDHQITLNNYNNMFEWHGFVIRSWKNYCDFVMQSIDILEQNKEKILKKTSEFLKEIWRLPYDLPQIENN